MRIVIIVEGGVIQDVYSTEPDGVRVVIVDHDTDRDEPDIDLPYPEAYDSLDGSIRAAITQAEGN